MASGGELSRISLAVEVVRSGASPIPTFVFDEVDAGVGGRVAEIVGRKLSQLGATPAGPLRDPSASGREPGAAALPRREAHGRQDEPHERPRRLSAEERVEELSRMLGGIEITDARAPTRPR